MLGVLKMLACYGEKSKKPLPKNYRDSSISCVHNNRQAGNNRTKTRNSQIIHKRKVTSIKQQIKDGTYNFDEKLDFAMDKLIENILSPKN
jgi:anti-sigma28 factor (negative regulator of flagellin synthesis)